MHDERPQRNVSRFPLLGAATSDIGALILLLRRLSIERSLEGIAEIVTQGARTLLNAGGVTFVLREGEFCHYADEDAISPLWKGKRFAMSACISGWCMTKKKPAVIRDIYQDPRIPHDAYRPTFVRSLAMVPVRQDDPIAAMGAYWPDVREISAEEVALLQAIANSAALAMANVQGQQEKERQEDCQEDPAGSGMQRACILAGEATHRMRNLLTLVDTLATQTADEAGSLEQFREIFHGRLHALARAQDHWFADEPTNASLRDLVMETVESSGADLRRIRIEGDPVTVAPRQIMALNLTFHELCTNAIKHGALSGAGGQVDIKWAVEESAEAGRVRILWLESGGPEVEPPQETGFGMKLIRSLCPYELQGHVEARFERGGLECEVAFPLA